MLFRPSRSMPGTPTWSSLENCISSIAQILALEVL